MISKTMPLYRPHELAFRTQYAEVKERTGHAGPLLNGSPGTLYKRGGTGHAYWYRVYYPLPGKQSEEFVGTEADDRAYNAMRDRIEHSEWTAKQVANLRKLHFQVADKGVASVLVELSNRKLFDAGLMMVGTLAYMCWLNEYGAMAVAARTHDVDLARRKRLKLATPISFLSSLQATQLPDREGLRVDLLAPGPILGEPIRIPELEWHAQAIPHYEYLLEDSQNAAMLAGGHCIPVKVPRADHMIWHKLYASTQRAGFAEKASKDIVQATTLASILVEQDSASLKDSFTQAPQALRRAALARVPRVTDLLASHPETKSQVLSLRP